MLDAWMYIVVAILGWDGLSNFDASFGGVEVKTRQQQSCLNHHVLPIQIWTVTAERECQGEHAWRYNLRTSSI